MPDRNIDTNHPWQNDLLRDNQGNIMPWEHNIDLILRNDPDIMYALQFSAREMERATIDALLFLQSRYKLRADYHVLSIMVKVASETYARQAIRAALST
jgi:hypothetical protein